MEFATCPCRHRTASCGACVEEPKYPRAMRALAEGNSIPGASAKSGCWIAQEVAAWSRLPWRQVRRTMCGLWKPCCAIACHMTFTPSSTSE